MIQPRVLAIEAISRIKHDGAYANLVTNEMLSKAKYSSQDAAFFTDLVNGSIRYLRFLDFILAQCVSRKLEDIEPDLLIILEIAAYSYLIKQKAAHAVVNEAVESAREVIGERAVGFCNGALRRLVRTSPFDWNQTLSDVENHDERESIRYSLPIWIYQEFRKQISDDRELAVLLDTLNQPPLVSLLRPPQNKSILRDLVPGNWSPFAYREKQRGVLGKTLMDSNFVVQDEGSQLVSLATLLAPIEGNDQEWLDMTAGPGGKATFLAAAAQARKANLTANELHPHRAKLISNTLARLNLMAEVTIGDALSQNWGKQFDRVLLDAPCTGLGALRRRSESRWRKQPNDLISLVDLQKKLLHKAITVTRPGGVVAYTTCSPHPRETDEVIDFALKTANVEVIDASALLPAVPTTDSPFLRLWPQKHGTDGMFLAILKVS